MSSLDSSSGNTLINGMGNSGGSSTGMSMGLMTSMISIFEQMISQQIQNATPETDQGTTDLASLVKTVPGAMLRPPFIILTSSRPNFR